MKNIFVLGPTLLISIAFAGAQSESEGRIIPSLPSQSLAGQISSILEDFTVTMLPQADEEILDVQNEETEANEANTASSWTQKPSGSSANTTSTGAPASPGDCVLKSTTVTYKNCRTGEITRIVKYDANGKVIITKVPAQKTGPEAAPTPTPNPTPSVKSGPQEPLAKISAQTIANALANGRPNTYYIAPANYRQLNFAAISDYDLDQSAIVRLTTYGNSQIKANNWTGGLKAWNVTQLPKKSTTLTLSFEYRLSTYEPQDGKEGQSAVSLDPAFGLRNRQLVDAPHNLTLKKVTPEWTKVEETFSVPEDANQFVIRPGFTGGDKGTLDLRHVKITVQDRARQATPTPTHTPQPTASPAPSATPVPTATPGPGTGPPPGPTPDKLITQGAPTGQEDVPSDNREFELEVFRLVNEIRVNAGLQPLVQNDNLSRAARYHALDMATDKYFCHDTMDRDENGNLNTIYAVCWRVHAFTKKGAGENIAAGQKTPLEVVDAWMKSPPHKANILGKIFKSVGTGYVQGHWVQDFGLE